MSTAQAAPPFQARDERGDQVTLEEKLRTGPVLLVFYPHDLHPICTRQLCDYRDQYQFFVRFGIHVLGISANSITKHAEFSKRNGFPFRLLADVSKRIALAYGCVRLFSLGPIMRAIVVINQRGEIVYRRAELLPLTWPKAEKTVETLRHLRANGRL